MMAAAIRMYRLLSIGQGASGLQSGVICAIIENGEITKRNIEAHLIDLLIFIILF
jgi:hypothetical protein